MENKEKNIKVKMSVCPECGGTCRVTIESAFNKKKAKKEFIKEVISYNLDIKTMSLEEYKKSGIGFGCKENCSLKKIYYN